ncbi:MULTISPECIES: phage infection protein [unclassified Bradyrhizobium]
MPKISIDLENCYGIKKLKADFDFKKARAFAIYAPNGAMKSSLATTFQDIAEGQSSKDRIFPTRTTKRTVTIDGTALSADAVLVVRPYDEVFGNNEKTSTLLINAKLKQEYISLHEDIEECKSNLIKALQAQSGSKRDLEREISRTFTASEDQFGKALFRIESEVLAQKSAPFSDVDYDTVFDDKVMGLLATKDVKTAIEDYIKKYNELLANSTYFKRGIFNYYNAASVAKSLADHGFFKANHSINLVSGTRLEISNAKDLEALISKEKEGITNDTALRKKFSEIEKLIQKNATVRDFQSYIEQREDLLANLANADAFREEVWKSYIFAHVELYKELLAHYRAVEKRKAEIERAAATERTRWEETIEIFNDRFFVPFELVAKNKISVMLGEDPVLNLGFIFKDGTESTSIDREALISALSTGEKKALYVLNIIFEIEARRAANQKTVLVVDDIADSFDYKNKYAIIQYLKDIADDETFNQIILTHNFDFFRTVNSRFVDYDYCYMASKSSAGLSLQKAAGIKNIFVNDWKINFHLDAKKRIASIPFIRNLVEFTKGDADDDYGTLTSLLHWKADSTTITRSALAEVYNRVFHSTITLPDGSGSVLSDVFTAANECLKATEGMNFENKVVLSIATRLAAEKFMAERLKDEKLLAGITSAQTPKLLREYKKRFGDEAANIAIIERVMLMTPENIHLNSFMYEPIIDMSDDHLRKLYRDVETLS